MPTYLIYMSKKKFNLGFYSELDNGIVKFLITSPNEENILEIINELNSSAMYHAALNIGDNEFYNFKGERYYVAKYDYKEYNPTFHKIHCKNGCKCGSDWVPVSA